MLVIRNVEERDIERVADININCWKKCYNGIIEQSVIDSIDKNERVATMTRSMDNGIFIVAEEDSQVKGFCRYVTNNGYSPNYDDVDCEVCAIYVDVDFQRKGIGSKMLEYALEDLKRQDKKKLIIWCLKANTNARMFYTQMGGEVYAERKFEIMGKEYDEIAYEYNI